jgi:hypothetical protein
MKTFEEELILLKANYHIKYLEEINFLTLIEHFKDWQPGDKPKEKRYVVIDKYTGDTLDFEHRKWIDVKKIKPKIDDIAKTKAELSKVANGQFYRKGKREEAHNKPYWYNNLNEGHYEFINPLIDLIEVKE